MIERTIGVEMIKELGCNLIIYYRGLPDRSICLVLDREKVQKITCFKNHAYAYFVLYHFKC